MTVSVVMYKRLGMSNTDIALYTSWLYLPWVIKPFWSPFVDILKTKRAWIIAMQLLIGAGLGGVALTIPTDDFFRNSLVFLWLLAFSSATHDIAADGFYMLGLSKHDQTWFVGIRSTFYRLAMIAGQGLLIMLAGSLEELMQSPGVVSTDLSGSGVESGIAFAWVITFYVMAGLFLCCSLPGTGLYYPSLPMISRNCTIPMQMSCRTSCRRLFRFSGSRI